MKIGVLALQGAFREHRLVLEKLGVEVVEVRKKEQLAELAGLVIPGGESTTIGKLMVDFGLLSEIKERFQQGMAVFGTCAGLILLATEIMGSEQPRLGLMEMTVKRNAYGRQVDSFEVDLPVPAIGAQPLRAVFIRAPYIERVGSGVEVMATFQDKIVLARQGKALAAAFHPELTEDYRLHQYFVDLCKK
ncbi:MAG: pyridoxal 5'-phosphate synthase glutaminase subunit PdxT [Bacillota bacterium]|uniref:Pyridoxal 5'-phosphate synthase subunit PdxT n=2 Tax=Carboxydocella TaxID=178898 RepID=A0A1T4MJA3_9FIRM|nr:MULTISPECIES: pyridoxal 5'-phosphate synthase glutaminase subunit PdxT [Carboxydocella]AVX21346.1 pyridoxal phosphate synthase yaaE subunit [Carboxydocella thermautotrophica]AVX31774.1 pyridoxal phosphate synthase yaaE subunit [Carboxydocella thermautotrophica]SJZ66915.1 pyridoxal phosphate synthase yaaE subunit [Carboxydocella sporoproducens DSM 16521]GAW28151.1 pyridoxal phosphate synthase yaaE subunit [Carboxydocella sp. ULO1]GAW31652.1 pyridoxal phosphate synthase yaaE subunit [Carboxyd